MSLLYFLLSIHDKKESVATVDEVEVFHAALNAHLGTTVGLRPEAGLHIRRLDMPIVKMDAGGKVRSLLSSQ